MDDNIRKRGSKQDKPNYSWSDTTDSTDEEDVPRDTSSSDSDLFVADDHSVDGTLCSCCNDMFENHQTMYKCSICNRVYHPKCHVPEITDRFASINWQCTLCEDMETISKDLGKNGNDEDLNSGTVGRKIAERILMELCCSGEAIDAFREVPHVNIFPSYSGNIVDPLALNTIKDHLRNYQHVYKLSEFMNDTKLLFAYNMAFFDIGDPNFDAAWRLLTNLKSLNSKWVAHNIKRNRNISRNRSNRRRRRI